MITQRSTLVANVLLAACECCVAVVLALAAAAKLGHAQGIFGVMAVALDSPWAARVASGVAVGLETGISIAIAVRVLTGVRAVAVGVTYVLFASAVLLAARRALGGDVSCSCIAGMAASTIDESLQRNVFVCGELLAVTAVAWWIRRRDFDSRETR